MAVYLSDSLRQEVYVRANYRCEYCLTSQRISGGQMHIEHILPSSRGGTTETHNLCLACAWCNSYKGTKIEAIDPISHKVVSLFNPRTQQWADHFQWHAAGVEVMGMTPIGRATVEALKMNNEYIVPAREQWLLAGWHPPRS
ncbi:MAG: HNH endonuclease [Ardenticatenaceae bacterium]|nr:HNH endonuclease [Ardenticatenaceae bacterium]